MSVTDITPGAVPVEDSTDTMQIGVGQVEIFIELTSYWKYPNLR